MSDLDRRFESLIKRLLVAKGFQISSRERNFIGHTPDLIARHENREYLIEIKLYRSTRVSPDVIRMATSRLQAVSSIGDYFATRLLIVSASLDNLYVQSLGPQIDIWDHSRLQTEFASRLDLKQEYDSILREARPFYHFGSFDLSDLSIPISPIPLSQDNALFPREGLDIVVTPEPVTLRTSIPSPGVETSPTPEETRRNFCQELNDISAGRSGAIEFEEKCTEILKYIFKDDLTAWKKQSRTGTGLHRFDLIARIASDNDFWKALIHDYKSRYIVFEFKNYTDKISQGEIYSTEKYLYPAAMRGIAIIFSRLGADDNAVAAAYGALREAGKVIFVLTIADVCEMVRKYEAGDEPTNVLLEKLDEMMMSIER